MVVALNDSARICDQIRSACHALLI